MNRIPVTSTNLMSVGYEHGTLEIEFRSGSVYQYYGVPENIYRGLMGASSKGTYHHQHIKNAGFTYKQIR